MTDAPKQNETTTPPADDKDHIVHPDSLNPHIVPEKDPSEEATEE